MIEVGFLKLQPAKQAREAYLPLMRNFLAATSRDIINLGWKYPHGLTPATLTLHPGITPTDHETKRKNSNPLPKDFSPYPKDNCVELGKTPPEHHSNWSQPREYSTRRYGRRDPIEKGARTDASRWGESDNRMASSISRCRLPIF